MPVLLLTAQPKPQQIVVAMQAGISGYVIKPFTSRTLKEKLERSCMARRLQPDVNQLEQMAPRVGIEPTTNGLTVRRSTAELPRNWQDGRARILLSQLRQVKETSGLGPPG